MIEPQGVGLYDEVDEKLLKDGADKLAKARREAAAIRGADTAGVVGLSSDIGPYVPRRLPNEQADYARYRGVGVNMTPYPYRQDRMQQRTSPAEEVIYANMQGTAQRVIDGDSFMYNGEEYRIANIAAPEWDTESGPAATAALRNQLQNPYNIHAVGTDKYGRTLATLSRRGSDIGEQMIESGNVEAWQQDWRPPEEKGFGKKLVQLPWNMVKGIARSMYFWESDIKTKERFYRLANVGLMALPIGGPLAWAAKGLTGLTRALTIGAGEALVAGGIEMALGERDSVIPHMLLGGVLGGTIGGLAGMGRSKITGRAARAFRGERMLSKTDNPLTDGSRYSVLSAHKDGLSAADNLARTADLSKELDALGVPYTPVVGVRSKEALSKAMRRDGDLGRANAINYEQYMDENAFLVPGMTTKQAAKIARRWDQDSLLTSDGLIDFRGRGGHRVTTRPIKGHTLSLGQEVDDLADYFSTTILDDGRQLHWSLDFGPEKIMGKVDDIAEGGIVAKQLDTYVHKDPAERGLLGRFGARTIGQLGKMWYIKNIRAVAGLESVERAVMGAAKKGDDLIDRASVWIQQSKSSPAALAEFMVTDGVPVRLFSREIAMEGLIPLLKGHGITAETFGVFDDYLVGRRLLAMDPATKLPVTRQGQMSRPELESWVNARPESWKKAAEAVYDWDAQVKTVLLGPEGGNLLTADRLAALIERGDDYVPFEAYQRLQETMRGITVGPDGVRVQSLSDPVKVLGELSQAEIHSPLGAMMRQAHSFAGLAYKQRATNAFMDMIGKLPLWEQSRYVRKVTKLPKDLQELVDGAVLREENEFVRDVVDQLFVPHMEQTSGFISRVDPESGLREWFEIADKGLLEAFKFMQPSKMGNELVDLFAAPSKWLRAGTTLSFEFLGRNIVRDVAFSTVVGGQNMANFLKGASALIGKRTGRDMEKWVDAYFLSGAARSSMVSPDIPAMRKTLEEMMQEGIRIKNVVKSPLRFMQLVSETGEQITRVGNFKSSYQKFISQGMPMESAMFNASLLAKTSSVDFAMHGSGATVLPALRVMTAFWNPMLQGMDTFARALKNDPLGVGRRAFIGITIPSMLLYAHNRRDPEYKSLPQWEKSLFWHVKIGGEWARIPKPFEPGMIFGSQVEKFLEFVDTEDPAVMDEFYVEYLKDLTMEALPIPTMARPFIELAANRNFFRGAPIVSKSQEAIDPMFRESPGTSDFSKAMMRYLHLDKIGMDALKLDHLLVSWTGAIGRDVMNIGDKVLFGHMVPGNGEDPSKGVHSIPLMRGFVSRFPSNSNDFDDFYQATDKVRSATATYNELEDRFKFEDAQQFAMEHAALMGLSSANNKWVKQMAELRDIRKDIINNPFMNGDKKRDLIDALERRMMRYAQAINGQIASMERKK